MEMLSRNEHMDLFKPSHSRNALTPTYSKFTQSGIRVGAVYFA